MLQKPKAIRLIKVLGDSILYVSWVIFKFMRNEGLLAMHKLRSERVCTFKTTDVRFILEYARSRMVGEKFRQTIGMAILSLA